MIPVVVQGIGAVSPAGWGVPPMMDAIQAGAPLLAQTQPGWPENCRARLVPSPASRPSFAAHPRLRRSSAISHYLAGAALEALADHDPRTLERMTIISCSMCGGVRYTRRFFAEAKSDPALASPLLFPETVFNAPASHLSALLNLPGATYTFIGDPGVFLQAIAQGAQWIETGLAESVLVLGAEEADWPIVEASRLLSPRSIVGEGAAAVWLGRPRSTDKPRVKLERVTSPRLFRRGCTREVAAKAIREELPREEPGTLLCDSQEGVAHLDRGEQRAWSDWKGARISPKKVLGEGMVAAGGWQCVAALEMLRRGEAGAALLSVLGCNTQAIGAHFLAGS